MSSLFSTTKRIEIKPVTSITPDIDMKDNQDKAIQQLNEEVEKLTEILAEKKKLLKETSQSIKKEKEDWEAEKKVRIEHERQKGYQDGYERGKQDAMDQYQLVIHQVNDIHEQSIRDYHEKISASKLDMLEIALLATKKIIKKNLKEDRTLYLSIITEAIKEMKTKEFFTVYVPLQAYEQVQSKKIDMLHTLENKANISIKLKADLSSDGCLIEHSAGVIDVGIDTQLTALQNALKSLLMESSK